jgi:AmiR/NasT family two-component response regulator
MDHLKRGTHDGRDPDRAPMQLERIPSPFVWVPARPAAARVAVVGGLHSQRAGSSKVLRASGQRVTPYAAADGLLEQLQRQTLAVDVVVLHEGSDSSSTIGALERLRAHCGALGIVLIANDAAEVLAEAKRLRVEEILVPPVHPVALRAAVAAAAMASGSEAVADEDITVF